MVNVSLGTAIFNEEENFLTVREKFSTLLEPINADLVTVDEDSTEDLIIDTLLDKHKNLIEDNFGEFLTNIITDIKKELDNHGYPHAYEFKLLNQELSYGYVLIIAGAIS